MHRPMLAGLAVATALGGAALANPVSQDPAAIPKGTYELDPRHASLIVRVPHMGGFSRFTMRFDRLQGGFTLDPADWAATTATITVDPASIDTGLPDFDRTIAGPAYFDSPRFPTITFMSRSLENHGGRGTISGDLTFHGVTRPVVLDVTFNGVGPGMLGAGTRMGFSGSTRIRRSDFGVTAMSAFAGDEADLSFEVEFVRK